MMNQETITSPAYLVEPLSPAEQSDLNNMILNRFSIYNDNGNKRSR